MNYLTKFPWWTYICFDIISGNFFNYLIHNLFFIIFILAKDCPFYKVQMQFPSLSVLDYTRECTLLT